MEFLEEEKPVLDPKRLKVILEAKTFINFLLRHVAMMTFRFNLFFHTRLVEFSQAMQLAEEWHLLEMENKRAKSGKKKKKEPEAPPVPPAGVSSSHETVSVVTAEELSHRMSNFKEISEAAVYLTEHNVASVGALIELLDFFGRMRGLLLIAGNLVALLTKNFSEESEKMEDVTYYLNHWTGFCARLFNCHIHRYPTNQLPSNLTPPEVQFIVWPLAVRTAIYCATQLIKDVSVVIDMDLNELSAMSFNTFLRAEEMMTMKNILDYFEAKHKNMFSPYMKVPDVGHQEKLPKVDPALEPYTEPITMDTILLNFPHEIPTDTVKKDKKGKAKKK